MKTKIRIVVALGIVFSLVLNIAGFAADCADVRRDVLRLHVVGASDSEYDQNLKLKVRDALIKKGGDVFDGTVTVDEAQKIITPRISELKEVAETVLLENGCDYNVDITVGEEYFATRCYENFTMPAGMYMAVRVNIGTAEGKNWWCVMFPPLCLPAAFEEADVFFDDDEMKVITSSPKYEPRFKIVEIFESIKNKLR